MNKVEVNRLLDQTIEGDSNAFNKLVITYQDYAYTIAFNILGNSEDAEEVAHDAFLKAYKNLGKFNRSAKFTTWLYRIVFNAAISQKRKRKVYNESLDDHTYLTYQENNKLEYEDKKYHLNIALKNLLDEDRVVLTLFYLEEMSLEEIADIVSMKVNNIKVRLHRARKRLAKELESNLKNEALNL